MRPHLYKRPCPSVRPLVRWSVMLSSKLMKNGLLRIPTDSDRAGRGRKRNKEEGGTRRKEQRGGRSDKSERMKKLKKWLEDASLTPAVVFRCVLSPLYEVCPSVGRSIG